MTNFHQLLRAAQDASEASDMFDLRSKDPKSMKKWNELRNYEAKCKVALINYIKEHPELLTEFLTEELMTRP